MREGGYYIGADGIPHDAWGNPIPNAPQPIDDQPETPADEWGGLSVALVQTLMKGGFATPGAVEQATDDELLAINGVGQKALATIRKGLG